MQRRPQRLPDGPAWPGVATLGDVLEPVAIRRWFDEYAIVTFNDRTDGRLPRGDVRLAGPRADSVDEALDVACEASCDMEMELELSRETVPVA